MQRNRFHVPFVACSCFCLLAWPAAVDSEWADMLLDSATRHIVSAGAKFTQGERSWEKGVTVAVGLLSGSKKPWSLMLREDQQSGLPMSICLPDRLVCCLFCILGAAHLRTWSNSAAHRPERVFFQESLPGMLGADTTDRISAYLTIDAAQAQGLGVPLFYGSPASDTLHKNSGGADLQRCCRSFWPARICTKDRLLRDHRNLVTLGSDQKVNGLLSMSNRLEVARYIDVVPAIL
jgi:hypothetical protein